MLVSICFQSPAEWYLNNGQARSCMSGKFELIGALSHLYFDSCVLIVLWLVAEVVVHFITCIPTSWPQTYLKCFTSLSLSLYQEDCLEKVINDTECLFKSREKEYQETIDQIEVRHRILNCTNIPVHICAFLLVSVIYLITCPFLVQIALYCSLLLISHACKKPRIQLPLCV